MKPQLRKSISRSKSTLEQEIMSKFDASDNLIIEETAALLSPTCEVEYIPHVSDYTSKDFKVFLNPMLGDSKYRSVFGGEGFLPTDAFIYPLSYVSTQTSHHPDKVKVQNKKFLKGGPRKHVYYYPEDIKAAIVTCGGLCPGLNVVIRELVMSLWYNYGCREIYGIKFGYKGFYQYDWMKLEPKNVTEIHKLGGTILGSSRGGFDLEKIMDALITRKISQVYVIGGDGTHRGATALFREIVNRKLHISIVGIPKTIDNDIPFIDKSFGFTTAVEEAQRAIESADVEANCAENGVGLVKLMGRDAGHVALHASLANRNVNICLIPEFPFEIEGPNGLLHFVAQRLRYKSHCVIVCAEGAGESVLDHKLGHGEKDASGNVKPGDIGLFLKERIPAYCKSMKVECNLKYIDPSYMIRSVAASAADKQLCAQFAQNAVHGVMAGFTGFTSSMVNLTSCYIPFEEITKEKRLIKPNDRQWQRLLASTGQPSFINAEEEFCEITEAEAMQEEYEAQQEKLVKESEEMIHRAIKRRTTETELASLKVKEKEGEH